MEAFNVKLVELRGKLAAELISRDAAVGKLHNWCAVYDFQVSDRDLEYAIDHGELPSDGA